MNKIIQTSIILLLIFFIFVVFSRKSSNVTVPAKSCVKMRNMLSSSVSSIKMSSLSYLNAAKRVGFDYTKYYNDFTSEGHMYPFHGVGDLDTTIDMMERMINSVSGKPFYLTDLNIFVKVTDESLIKNNPYFDFHNIPTRHLDGSTKLPDGTRIEQHITYFNPNAERDFPNSIADIDWISGSARLRSIPKNWDSRLLEPVPTTLFSTRQTPYLEQNEYLALSFFMDGKQSRVNNGGQVSNFRYVVPAYSSQLNWFVAKAWVKCERSHKKARKITTTNGTKVWVRPRTSYETENLDTISYNQNRYMETVSNTVTVTDSSDKYNSFNQRYSNKSVNFGDIMLLDKKKSDNSYLQYSVASDIDKIFDSWVTNRDFENQEKQIAFNEMIHKAAEYLRNMNELPSPYVYVKEGSVAYSVFNYIKTSYINVKLYDISITALCTKSQLTKSYIPTPIGETGWMVIEKPDLLKVPSDDGEYFIGWTIDTQPSNKEVVQVNSSLNGHKHDIIRWCQTNGYVIHQGPGIIYLTGGDMSHSGTQEPYLLEHNYKPVQRMNETDEQFKNRIKCQLPVVHWRLDSPNVISKSNVIGNFTEANVGAAQNMLLSVGTQTSIKKESRSPNFLGKYYQQLLASPDSIQNLLTKEPSQNEVYSVVGVDKKMFLFGEKQGGNVSY